MPSPTPSLTVTDVRRWVDEQVFLTTASYWGWQIGAKYGQAFLASGPLKIGDPMMLVKDVIPRP